MDPWPAYHRWPLLLVPHVATPKLTRTPVDCPRAPQVFSSSSRDLVKVGLKNKPWGAHQLVRLRRLNDVLRAVAAQKKTLDREVELMLRRTNELSLSFLSGPRKGLKAEVLHLQAQFRCAVTLMERFLEEGRRTQFTFPPMRNKGNRALLHARDAALAYGVLAAQGVDLAAGPEAPQRVLQAWGQLQRRMAREARERQDDHQEEDAGLRVVRARPAPH